MTVHSSRRIAAHRPDSPHHPASRITRLRSPLHPAPAPPTSQQGLSLQPPAPAGAALGNWELLGGSRHRPSAQQAQPSAFASEGLQGSQLRNQETCFNLGSQPHPNVYDV